MGEFIKKLRSQITEFWGALDKKKKIFLVSGSFLVVMTIAISIFLITKPEYVPLAQDLTLEEAAEITEKLDELGIPWKDENDSTAILVSKGNLSNAKMSLTLEGVLSKKDFTWTEAFASNSFSMTAEDKSKMFLLAQANALAESVKTIDKIEDAIVNLYIPNDSSFLVNSQADSKASVIIKMKNGTTLSEAEVKGIVMIFVNSVKGLEESKVSIVDTTGKELTKEFGDEWQVSVNSQIELQAAVEDRLEEKLTNFLSTLYGIDNVKVMPSVKLNFDSNETTSRVFSPPIEGEVGGMVRSISEITENVENDGAQGAPGTDSNGEATNYAETTSENSNYSKASRTVNYEMNEIVNEISKAKGTVDDITIAVILNQKVLKDNILTEDHETELKKLISASAGIDTRVVEVSAMEFPDESSNYDVFSNADAAGGVFGIPIWAFGVLAALILGFIIFMSIRRRSKAKEEEELLRERLEEEKARELEEIQAGYEDRSSPKYQIEKFIDSNPEAVALLLKAWLHED